MRMKARTLPSRERKRRRREVVSGCVVVVAAGALEVLLGGGFVIGVVEDSGEEVAVYAGVLKGVRY